VESEYSSKVCRILDAGFSLIELMVTIAVLAIIVTIGIPSFQSLFENSRLNRANDDFIAAVNLARSEAITRELPAGGVVVLCERNAAGTACSGDAAWADGLMVLEMDAGGNVLQVIRVWDPVATAAVAAGANGVAFSSDGRANPAVGFAVSVGTDLQNYCLRPTGSIFKGVCP
jgi:type IV fimbrial biogenesis protein FimT